MVEVKEAIKIAKSYVGDVFEDEGVFNIGLEEIEHDGDRWEVTVGFSRRWDKAPRNPFAGISSLGIEEDHRASKRTYKVVVVDEVSGNVIELRNRPGAA